MPMMKIADLLRLFALFVHAAHEAGGMSQAVCAPHDENCRHSQAFCTRGHEKGGTLQAACMPMMKIADSFRRFAVFARAAREKCGAPQAFFEPP